MLMNVKIHRPYVTLKDRPYSKNMLEIDLGEIFITSSEFAEKERFKNAPEKEVFLTKYMIMGSDLGIIYKTGDNKQYQVTDPFDLDLSFSLLNSSKYLGMIDSHDFDKSYKVLIELNPIF